MTKPYSLLKFTNLWVIPGLIITLSGCGGGGGGGGPSNDSPPTTSNNNSSIVSVSSASSSVAVSSISSASSSSTSAAAVAPTISSQPANISVVVGTSATFSVAITGGTAPITYQWKRNGTAIPGATSASYTLSSTVINDNAAAFSVDVINTAGTRSSHTAILTVTPGPGIGVNTTVDLIDDDVNDGVCHTAENTCSLRAAIMTANHSTTAGLTTIYVPAGVYKLTIAITGENGEDSGDLDLTTPLVANQEIDIIGNNAVNTFIDGNQIDGVLSVANGRVSNIIGVTIRNGNRVWNENQTSHAKSGGGIFNDGVIAVTACIVENNHSREYGGGIFSSPDALIIINGSIIRSNDAGTPNLYLGFGGGVYLATADSSILNSTIDGNRADYAGGIFTLKALTITGSIVTSNIASRDGGGLLLFPNRPDDAEISLIRNTTFSSNGANNGGAIWNAAYQINVVNSTISSNWANTNGGGLYSNNVGATLYNVTIFNNDADHDRDQLGGAGGGIYTDTGSTVKIRSFNSIIAGNTISDAPISSDCYARIESNGRNLFGDTTNCRITGSNWGTISVNTIDATLKDNGGTTFTHALLKSSQAIDSPFVITECIDPEGAALTTDQRGAPRVGTHCDIGAYEYGSAAPN